MKFALDILLTLALLRIAVRGKDGGEFLSEMKEEINLLFVEPATKVLGAVDVVCGKLNNGLKPSDYFNSLVSENTDESAS